MNESEYVFELRARWPRETEAEATPETMALADEAVRAFPDSPKLWCMRGDLIQLASGSCQHSLDDAGACYLRAIKIDPSFAEAYEEAAHFFDAVMGDEERAFFYFSEFHRLREQQSAASAGNAQ